MTAPSATTSFDYALPVTRVDTKHAFGDDDPFVGIAVEVTTLEALERLEHVTEEFTKMDIDFEEIAERLELDEDEEVTKKDLEEMGIKTQKIMEIEWDINPDTGIPQNEQTIYVYTEFAQEFLDKMKTEEFNPDGTLKPPPAHPDQYDLF